MFSANSVIRAKSNVISQMTNAIGKFMLDSNFLRCSFDFPYVIVTLLYLRARDIALHRDAFMYLDQFSIKFSQSPHAFSRLCPF